MNEGVLGPWVCLVHKGLHNKRRDLVHSSCSSMPAKLQILSRSPAHTGPALSTTAATQHHIPALIGEPFGDSTRLGREDAGLWLTLSMVYGSGSRPSSELIQPQAFLSGSMKAIQGAYPSPERSTRSSLLAESGSNSEK